jgi:hypothetical protein
MPPKGSKRRRPPDEGQLNLSQAWGIPEPAATRRRGEYVRSEGELASVVGVTRHTYRTAVANPPHQVATFNAWLVWQARMRGFTHHRAFTQERIISLIGAFEAALAADTDLALTEEQLRLQAQASEEEAFSTNHAAALRAEDEAKARQQQQLDEAQRNLEDLEPPADVPSAVIDVEEEMLADELRESLAGKIGAERQNKRDDTNGRFYDATASRCRGSTPAFYSLR